MKNKKTILASVIGLSTGMLVASAIVAPTCYFLLHKNNDNTTKALTNNNELVIPKDATASFDITSSLNNIVANKQLIITLSINNLKVTPTKVTWYFNTNANELKLLQDAGSSISLNGSIDNAGYYMAVAYSGDEIYYSNVLKLNIGNNINNLGLFNNNLSLKSSSNLVNANESVGSNLNPTNITLTSDFSWINNSNNNNTLTYNLYSTTNNSDISLSNLSNCVLLASNNTGSFTITSPTVSTYYFVAISVTYDGNTYNNAFITNNVLVNYIAKNVETGQTPFILNNSSNSIYYNSTINNTCSFTWNVYNPNHEAITFVTVNGSATIHLTSSMFAYNSNNTTITLTLPSEIITSNSGDSLTITFKIGNTSIQTGSLTLVNITTPFSATTSDRTFNYDDYVQSAITCVSSINQELIDMGCYNAQATWTLEANGSSSVVATSPIFTLSNLSTTILKNSSITLSCNYSIVYNNKTYTFTSKTFPLTLHNVTPAKTTPPTLNTNATLSVASNYIVLNQQSTTSLSAFTWTTSNINSSIITSDLSLSSNNISNDILAIIKANITVNDNSISLDLNTLKQALGKNFTSGEFSLNLTIDNTILYGPTIFLYNLWTDDQTLTYLPNASAINQGFSYILSQPINPLIVDYNSVDSYEVISGNSASEAKTSANSSLQSLLSGGSMSTINALSSYIVTIPSSNTQPYHELIIDYGIYINNTLYNLYTLTNVVNTSNLTVAANVLNSWNLSESFMGMYYVNNHEATWVTQATPAQIQFTSNSITDIKITKVNVELLNSNSSSLVNSLITASKVTSSNNNNTWTLEAALEYTSFLNNSDFPLLFYYSLDLSITYTKNNETLTTTITNFCPNLVTQIANASITGTLYASQGTYKNTATNIPFIYTSVYTWGGVSYEYAILNLTYDDKNYTYTITSAINATNTYNLITILNSLNLSNVNGTISLWISYNGVNLSNTLTLYVG